MKTQASVLVEPAVDINERIPIREVETRVCAHCGVKERELHPMRGFMVVLQPIGNATAESPQVCQICRLDHLKKEALLMKKHKKPFMKTLKQYLGKALGIVVILQALSGMVMAQPGLPNAPAVAPIDGGLGLLAAAGGTYALKKLRDRKKNDAENNTF